MIYLFKENNLNFLVSSMARSDDGSEFRITDPASPKHRASWTGEISDVEADRILQVWHWRMAQLYWTMSTQSDRYEGELWWIAEWIEMHILYLIRSLTDNHFNFFMSCVILISFVFSQWGILYTTLKAERIILEWPYLYSGKPNSNILQ